MISGFKISPGAATTSCESDALAGSVDCSAREFGSSLAVGRFAEDSWRDAHTDLAIGAPGTRVDSATEAGAVFLIPGEELEYPGNSPYSGPADVSMQGLTKRAYHNPGGATAFESTSMNWTIHYTDPVEGSFGVGDRYGTSLYTADLVRSFHSDLDQHWKDELIVGVPGQDLLETGLNTSPVVQGAGAVCSVFFGDSDAAVHSSPSSLYIGDEPGEPDAVPLQSCFGLGGTLATANQNSGARAGAELGTSVIAGRLSEYDPDVQISTGAPGQGSGVVWTLHFTSFYGEGLAFGFVEQPEEPEEPLIHIRPRVSQLDPSVQTAWSTNGGSAFGTTLARMPRDCGGVRDIVVGDPFSTAGGNAYATAWEENPALDLDLSARYIRTDGDTVISIARLPIPGTSPTAGETYVSIGSPGNEAVPFALDLSDLSDLLEFLGLSSSLEFLCAPLPFNLSALPSSMPTAPLDPTLCTEEGGSFSAASTPFYSTDGEDWSGFEHPRSFYFTVFGPPASAFELTLREIDLLDHGSLPVLDKATLELVLEFPQGGGSPMPSLELCVDATLEAVMGPATIDLVPHTTIDNQALSTCPGGGLWEFERTPDHPGTPSGLDCNVAWND